MHDVAIKAALAKPITHQMQAAILRLISCNTAGEHLAAQPDEMLLDWELFIRWTVQVGLVASESYPELTPQSLANR